MNTPETINIEKYANALNNLVGMDIGYLGDSDENVNAIVEVIRAAKALENRVKELTKENKRLRIALDAWEGEAEEARAENVKLTEENERLSVRVLEENHLRHQVEEMLADGMSVVKADTVKKMQERLELELDEHYSLYFRILGGELIDRVVKEILEENR